VMWDMQKGLAGKAPDRQRIQANAAKLVDAADRAGIMVVWSRHILPPLELTSGPFLLFLMRKQGVDRPEKLQPFMQPGMEDTDFLDGLQPSADHLVIEKSQPSLFVDTPLDLRLKTRGIKTVVLAGVATDIGVEFTARHAMASGYFAVIAEDATGAYAQDAHDRSMAFMRKWMTVAPSSEICRAWERVAG
jgi:nicotinamidase-related amidase